MHSIFARLLAGSSTVTFDVIVPGDPVGKGRPRFARRGRFTKVFTPKRTLEFESRVSAAAASVLPRFTNVDVLAAEILFVFARPKRLQKKNSAGDFIAHLARPDIDNTCKAVLDGLSAHFRDEQVVYLTAVKVYSELFGEPRTEIKIIGPDIEI